MESKMRKQIVAHYLLNLCLLAFWLHFAEAFIFRIIQFRGSSQPVTSSLNESLIGLCFFLSSFCVFISLLIMFKKSWKHGIAQLTMVLGFVAILCLGGVGALGYHMNKADSWNLDLNKNFANWMNQASPLAPLPEAIPTEAQYLLEVSQRQDRPILFKDIPYEMAMGKAGYLMHTDNCLVIGRPRHWFLLPVHQTIHTIYEESLKKVTDEIVPGDFEHYLTLIEADSGRQDIPRERDEELDYQTQKRLQLYLQWRFPRQTIGIVYHRGDISYVSHSAHKIIVKYNRPFVMGRYVEGSPFNFFNLDTLWYQSPYDIYDPDPLFEDIADQVKYGHSFLGNRSQVYEKALKIIFFDEGLYGTMPEDPYFLFENGHFSKAEQRLDHLPDKRRAFMAKKLD
jgi:hypothetical protein